MGKSTGSLKALVLSGAVLALFAGHAFAADLLPPPPPSEPPPAMPVAEFSGWYLRGDVGIGVNQSDKFRSTFVPGFIVPGLQYDQSSLGSHGIIGIGVGYQFNGWFRADLTGEYNTAAKWHAVESYTGACGPANRCVDTYKGSLSRGVFLANGYFDLGTWYNITPYVGAGIGVANNTVGKITDTSLDTGGNGYSNSVSKWTPAWALMAGAAVNLSPNMKLDFGYRYLNSGSITAGAIQCQPAGIACGFETHKFTTASHDFRIGLRYMFGDNSYAPAPMIAPQQPLIRKY